MRSEGAHRLQPRREPLQRFMLQFRCDVVILQPGKTLKDLGYDKVYNVGAFKDWVESGGAVDKPVAPGMTLRAA